MSFKEKIKEALKGRSKQEIVSFAWRCAIRALPFLAFKGDFNYWRRNEIQKNLYSIFHALLISFSLRLHICN